ncbi:hypothetical protein LAZ67_16002712 [Cordylochernes scorpioides]|uniref:TIL domain-containing protein n=1 Tax=Cordylochernes scorpioides TaxID=51811 RepID=A0ABY6LC80_9ARAC|nr:hypothetical protein LAZ67_16002712 [Cordylochernes scorpioides]
MLKTLALGLLLSFLVIVVVQGQGQECPENEKWSNCGTACQPNCSNYMKPIPCTKQCVQGCFCIAGYVRKTDKNSPCIRTAD